MSGELFQDFEKQSAAEWTEKLKADLRGKPIDSLMWKTQGVTGRPFYTSEDLDFELFNYSHFSQDSSLFGDRFWVNYQPVSVQDLKASNAIALDALQNGANGIVFELNSVPDWPILLREIQPEYCHLSFDLSQEIDANAFISSYKDYLKKSKIDINRVSGFLYSHSADFYSLGSLRTIAFSIENKGHLALDLALSMAKMIERVDQLTNRGLLAEDCLKTVFFKLNPSNDFFLEIARHRALRRLFESIVSAYGINDVSTEIISQLGPWDSEVDDPHSFMLHATTQAMSAIIGGADALLVQPFYSVFPNKPALAERIARNISSILSEESYLSKMVDPAAGSYYIEELTNTLYNDTLKLLQTIEKAGGISKIDVEQFKAENL